MKVLVTGATGFVGQKVVKQLLTAGDEVIVLTRYIPKAILTLGNECQYFTWDGNAETEPPLEAFEGVDGIINLMGEGLSEKRWTEEEKEIIYTSRVLGTRKLVEVIAKLPKKPSVIVSASAVGIYGDRGDEEITENSETVDDFLGRVCKDWESEAFKAKNLGLRVAVIRTGVVLGKEGGALRKMLPIFKMGVGGPLGAGKQYMSWIHVNDIAAMYVEALKNPSIEGAYNGTAPHPVTSKEFAKTLGGVLHRPAIAPVPSPVLKLVFGEMSKIMLEGQKVLPEKFQEKRFQFRYPNLEMALKESLR